MKMLISALIFLMPALAMASNPEVETYSRELSANEKIDLCRTFSDEKFCSSKIDPLLCLNDLSFNLLVTHLKGMPKISLREELVMVATDADWSFTKNIQYSVDLLNGEMHSFYRYETYSVTGDSRGTYVPGFVLDTSCVGDGDNED